LLRVVPPDLLTQRSIGLATIEKRYLPPIDAGTTINEADRARVYDIVRRQVADILAGAQSYYPDGVQKALSDRADDLQSLQRSIEVLQRQVNDPSDILGSVRKYLGQFGDNFLGAVDAGKPHDPIEMPKDQMPITRDSNELYFDPHPGPFSPPNPLSPSARPLIRRAEAGQWAAPGLSAGQLVRSLSSPFLHLEDRSRAGELGVAISAKQRFR
jgi:hypothetical protein